MLELLSEMKGAKEHHERLRIADTLDKDVLLRGRAPPVRITHVPWRELPPAGPLLQPSCRDETC